jgi:hypothetical protein
MVTFSVKNGCLDFDLTVMYTTSVGAKSLTILVPGAKNLGTVSLLETRQG